MIWINYWLLIFKVVKSRFAYSISIIISPDPILPREFMKYLGAVITTLTHSLYYWPIVWRISIFHKYCCFTKHVGIWTLRNHWAYIADMSKYHNAGIWNMDWKLLHFTLKKHAVPWPVTPPPPPSRHAARGTRIHESRQLRIACDW